MVKIKDVTNGHTVRPTRSIVNAPKGKGDICERKSCCEDEEEKSDGPDDMDD